MEQGRPRLLDPRAFSFFSSENLYFLEMEFTSCLGLSNDKIMRLAGKLLRIDGVCKELHLPTYFGLKRLDRRKAADVCFDSCCDLLKSTGLRETCAIMDLIAKEFRVPEMKRDGALEHEITQFSLTKNDDSLRRFFLKGLGLSEPRS